MPKRKISAEHKIYAVNQYLDGKESQHRIESMGADAFTLKGNKKYPKELKLQAVLDYLADVVRRMIFVKNTEFVQKLSYKPG